jgi:hypothetical protein
MSEHLPSNKAVRVFPGEIEAWAGKMTIPTRFLIVANGLQITENCARLKQLGKDIYLTQWAHQHSAWSNVSDLISEKGDHERLASR